MLVKECMTSKVEVGNPEMTLVEVAKRMRDGDFGILPIAQDDRLVGMVSDRDIVMRAVAESQDVRSMTAHSVMSKRVLYCYEDQSIEEVSQNLGDNQIRRLPVLNRQKKLVGILSLSDLAVADENPLKVEEALSRISRAVNPIPQTHN